MSVVVHLFLPPPSLSLSLCCIYVSVVWTTSDRRTSAITVVSDVRLSIVVAIKTRCITSRAYCSMFLVQYVNMPMPCTHRGLMSTCVCMRHPNGSLSVIAQALSAAVLNQSYVFLITANSLTLNICKTRSSADADKPARRV